MNIGNKAIEAAARQLAAHGGCNFDAWQEYYRSKARAALEAAAPHMLAEDRAKVWDEALEAGEHWCRDLNPSEIANPYRRTP